MWKKPNSVAELIETVKQYFPDLEIFSRAFGITASVKQKKSGVNFSYRETLESALKMGEDCLQFMGIRAFQARRSAAAFKQHDAYMVEEVSKYMDDEKTMFSKAKEIRTMLEQQLRDDNKNFHKSDDVAWDTTQLRQAVNQNKFEKNKE